MNQRDACDYHVSPLLTQDEVAARFGITRSRVQQIEQKAFRKIRAAIAADARARGITVAEWIEGAALT